MRVVAALFAGTLFSQSAEFSQQYLQRLGGAADEMRVVVERFAESARASELSPDEAIARLKENSDNLAARQGTDAEANLARYAALEERYRELIATTPLFRPFEVLSDPDWAIVERTGSDYRPAFPATFDGLLLAAMGFLLGWACGAGGHGAVAMRKRRRERSSRHAEEDMLQ